MAHYSESYNRPHRGDYHRRPPPPGRGNYDNHNHGHYSRNNDYHGHHYQDEYTNENGHNRGPPPPRGAPPQRYDRHNSDHDDHGYSAGPGDDHYKKYTYERHNGDSSNRENYGNVNYKEDYYDDYYEDYDGASDYNHSRRSENSSSRGRQQHNSRQDEERRQMAPLSQTIVFLGLPPSADEDMFRAWLESFGTSVDTTVIIRDRQTGLSKRFGFARFSSIEHARTFLEPNFPYVSWNSKSCGGDPEDDGLRVRIDYSAQDKPHEPSSRKKDEDPRSLNDNDGTRDIGMTPHHCILIRSIDYDANEEDICAALDRVPTNKKIPVHSVILIRDRKTHDSWGFAFVQFSDVQSASAIFAKVMDPKAHPQGFRILGKPVAVTFAHSDSFFSLSQPSQWSFVTDNGHVAYWDRSAYCELWKSPTAPEQSSNQAPILENTKKVTNRPEAAATATSKTTSTAESAANEDKKKKSVTGGSDVIASKKIAVNIKAWDKKKQELESVKEDLNTTTAPQAELDTSVVESNEFQYADLVKKTCLLCMRQFKTIEEIKKHNNLSSLHKGNLEKEETRNTALQRKRTAEEANGTSIKETPKYRDRALERRIALGQPDLPDREVKKAKRSAEGPEPPVVAEVTARVDKPIDESNKGSKMLEAMGYKKGESLGLSQSGTTAPVTAQIYSQGIGLGAAKGVAVGMQPEGTLNSAEYGREKARQRSLM